MSKKNNKKHTNAMYYAVIAASAVVIIGLIGWMIADYIANKEPNFMPPNKVTQNNSQKLTGEDFIASIDKTGAKKAEFIMTDGQRFVIEVYPSIAPITAENFVNLVEDGFYDGLTFHRVIAGFMAQGGAFDPDNQANDPAESIKGEFTSNGFENNMPHIRGVVSMARTQDPNSASSQFFVCYDEASHLDGEYAAFGFVTEGMETIDSFLDAGTDESDKPLKEVKIESAKIIE